MKQNDITFQENACTKHKIPNNYVRKAPKIPKFGFCVFFINGIFISIFHTNFINRLLVKIVHFVYIIFLYFEIDIDM